MVSNGLFRNEKAAGYTLVDKALGDKFGDLAFAGGQVVYLVAFLQFAFGPPVIVAQHTGCECTVKPDLAGVDFFYGGQQRSRGTGFEQQAVCPANHRPAC